MAAVKQISVRQLDNTYLTNPIGADAENVDIDSTHTLADKASDWDSKVDSVSGKGLSTNDYTTEEKTKLGNIESGAEVNVIETITVNGTAQTVTNKTVNIPVPSTENLAPINHASTTTIYGVATTNNYGHVKFGKTAGTAVEGNDSRLSNARKPVAHATNAATYGLGTDSLYGHVKVVNAAGNTRPTDLSAAASAQSVYDSLTNLANVFDATESYAVGDYVIYNGVFYKCTTAHTGAWDANDFTQTLVSDNLEDDKTSIANKSDISELQLTGTTNSTGSTIVNGTWFYLNGVLVRAIADIANGATFTEDTNYEVKTVGEELSELNDRYGDQVTVTGNSLSFVTDSAQAASNTVINLEPIQVGSGDPSPSNVRAISGYDDIRLYASGNNLLGGIQFAKMIQRYAGGTIDTTNKTITFNGSRAMNDKILIKLDPQKSYTCIITAYAESGDSLNIQYADVNGNRLGGIVPHDSLTNSKQTTKCVINNPGCINLTYASANNTVIYYDECGIFEGDIEIEDFEPYISTTDITIPAPDGTIYGGTLDVESGELVVDRIGITYNGSESGYDAGDTGIYGLTVPSGIKQNQTVLCNEFKGMSNRYSGSLNLNECALNQSGNSINFKTSYQTLADFKTFLGNNNLQLVYELATPKTYHLSPHQVKLLQGATTVTTNGTSLQLTYREKGEMAGLADLTGLADSVEGIGSVVDELNKRVRKNILSNLSNLPQAISEQNLEKYGYTIGDYFDGPSGYTYILADQNPFKGRTRPYCILGNHLGIVVDTHQTSQWHTGDASNVGYAGSVLHSYLAGTVLDNIKSDIAALFGDWKSHLIAHSKLLTTALANWAWTTDQYISALTCTQADAGSQCTANEYQEGEASKSLELFRKYKWTEIFGYEYPWTRCLSNYSSGSYACYLNNFGNLQGGRDVGTNLYAVGLICFK